MNTQTTITANMASMKSNICTAENRSFECNGEVVRFVPSNYNNQESMEICESGFCSPQTLLGHHSYKCISPNSRLQAIVRSQFELMELVKTMPESSYELSLTDLVENPRSETRAPQPWGPDNDRDLRSRSQENRKSDRITRSASFENKGLLLRMVFPVGLPSKRKKSLDKNGGGRSKLPKVCGETEWWKKRFTASTDSDSSRTSGGGGRSQDSIGYLSLITSGKCNRGRQILMNSVYESSRLLYKKRNGVLGNCCWPFFQSKIRIGGVKEVPISSVSLFIA